MATLTDNDLKNRLEHGVWLDEVERSFRDWRAAPNAEKPAHLLSGMMLTWAESWRLTNPDDFSPAVHTYISRSIQSEASKSSAEREAKAAETVRRDRVYQQILLLMALFAIVMLAPSALRHSLIGPEPVTVAPQVTAQPKPPEEIVEQTSVDPTPAKPVVDHWVAQRLLDRARAAQRGPDRALAPMFALESIAAEARQRQTGATARTDTKWTEAILAMAASLGEARADAPALRQHAIEGAIVHPCAGGRLRAQLPSGAVMTAELTSGASAVTAADVTRTLMPAGIDAACRMALASTEDHDVVLRALGSADTGRRLGNHDAPLVDARFSGDGLSAITASRDGTAKVWDAARGKHKMTLPTDDIAGAALSFDGRLAVTWSDGQTVKLWDVALKRELGALAGHKSQLTAAHFTDDAAHLLTVSVDGTAMVWSTATPTLVAALRPRGGSILDATMTADASRVIARLDGDRVQVWDVAQAAPLADLSPGDDKVHLLAADQTGAVVATADRGGTISVWDAASGRRLFNLQTNDALKAMVFSEDGRDLIAYMADSTLRWRVPRSLADASGTFVRHGACVSSEVRVAQHLPDTTPEPCSPQP